jgi:tetratricopeptide (TPR) repeat protein
MRPWIGVATVVLAGSLRVAPAVGQDGLGIPGGELLRQAAVLESQGDLDGAEQALESLLRTDPTSAGAIFALQRVLKSKSHLLELRPFVDAFLTEKEDPEVHGLELELMVAADSTDAMVDEAKHWLDQARRDPAAYRTVADVYEQTFGPERALEVLQSGRAALGPPALALELGDMLVKTGSLDEGVDEWARSVAEDGSGIDVIEHRLDGLGDRKSEAAKRLVTTLGESKLPEQRRTASRLAIELGIEPEALVLTQQHASELTGRERASYLSEVARLARQSKQVQVASWAFGEMGKDAGSREERRQYDLNIVEVAIEAGDTAAALEAQRRVASSYAPNTDEGRQARAQSIRFEAVANPDGVSRSFAAFRADFPDAPETDEVAAAISAALQARGDLGGAGSVLDGVDGPRSALERAYLLLGAGDIAGARAPLVQASAGLPPVEATSVIQFIGLLGRLSDAGTKELVTASVAAHRGKGGEAATHLAEATAGLPAGDRAPLLAEAARLADESGLSDQAADMRRRIIDEYPNTPEFGEASLELARHIAGPGGDDLEAIQMLEDLITSRPNAAIVPEARLELQRLRNRGL